MKRKTVNAIKTGIIGLIFLSIISSMVEGYAYLSGAAVTKENRISFVAGEKEQEGAITVVEPEWDARKKADAGYAMNLQPGQTAVKDPRVKSSVDYSCWVFVEVCIPATDAVLEKEDNPYGQVIFSGNGSAYFDAFEMVVPEINQEDWELYSRQAGGKLLASYVYGFKTPLVPGGTTSPVFETITVPEFKEADGGNSYIMVRAKVIQTEGCSTLDEAAKKLGIERSVEITIVTPHASLGR